MKLAGRAEAADLDRRALELLSHFRALRRRQRDLHAVLVRRPQLDRIEPRFGQVLDDRRNVPVFRDVVGDRAELAARAGRRHRRLRRLRRLPNRPARAQPQRWRESRVFSWRQKLPVPSCQFPVNREPFWKLETLGTGNFMLRSRDQSETPARSTLD